MKIAGYFIFLTLVIIGITGCATAPVETGPRLHEGMPGFYHRVERGQTLWRISKMYNIDLDDLATLNHISDATNIEVGQMVFIPKENRQRAQADYSSVASSIEDFIWPVRGRVIAGYGQTYNNMVNKGLNIEPYGNTDVVASASGRVVFFSPSLKGYGRTVIIDHGEGLSTVYARNSEVFVKAGDSVRKGQLIAKAGSTGGRDRNTYLHFEIRKRHCPQNPNFFLQ